MIGHFFIFKHNILSVKVRCPKCGDLGNLNVQTSSPKKRYQIAHLFKTKTKKCQFGWTSEYYEDLEKIYEELIRKREEEGELL